MVLVVLRALFVLLMGAIGYAIVGQGSGLSKWWTVAVTLSVGVVIVCIDILAPRRKLTVVAGAFMGLLVGVLVAYGLTYITALVMDTYIAESIKPENQVIVTRMINLLIGVICCYLAISFILQTKDDFRFIIPYVEFSKKTKGARPILLDTSVLIDGRITDIASTGILESQLIVPRFVIDEMQTLADQPDRLKRNRGRRGLDVVAALRDNRKIDLILYDSSGQEHPEESGVDQKLMTLATELSGRVLTNDFNLNKVAQLRGVDIININDLGNALKPVVLPGERMSVRLLKAGEEPGQGVGYLADGTMIVVEQGSGHLGEDIEFTVTSVLQTSAGRMIFGRMGESPPAAPRRGRVRNDGGQPAEA